MNRIIVLAVLIASVACEPPVSGGYGGGGGGGGGGNFADGPDEGQIPGAIVDQALLNRITEILNQQESSGGGGGGGYSAPQSSYGAPPASSYGAPSSGGRIELGKVSRGNLVANFVEQGRQQGGYSGGGSSGGSSGGYGK